MSKVGTITFNGPDDNPEGYIATLQLKLRFWMEASGMTGPNAPFYYIFSDSGGGPTQIGAAWKKVMRKPGKEPVEFLSISIDDPSFPQALNVAAFKNADGTWDITFRRRQDRTK